MTKLRNLLALTAASVFLLGAFTGCKKNSESPSPEPEAKTLESIILEVSPAALKVGDKAGLKVTATYSDKTTSDVSEKAVITPSDTSVASVQGTTLTALKEGSVNVVASYKEGEKTVSSPSVSVEVSNTPEPAVKTLVTVLLQTSPSPMNLLVNATATLAATAEYSDGTTADVSDKATFTSSDTSVATIQGKTLTAVKAGTSKITATYKEGEIEKTSGESTVTVSNSEAEQPVFTLESIEAGGDFTLTVGETKDITVTAKYKKKVGEVVTDESVTVTSDATFHSSVLSVAEFDGTYKNRLKALSAGSTVITVNYEDGEKRHASTTITVTVKEAEKPATLESISIEFGKDLSVLSFGETTDLSIWAKYSNTYEKDVSAGTTVSSSDEKVVKVSGRTLEGVGIGEATITARYSEKGVEKTADIKVTVNGKKINVAVPDWTWNDGTKVFVWGWNENSKSEDKDGSWVEASGAGEKSTTVTFPAKNVWTGFLLARCQKDTTEPNWDMRGNDPGRIYNKSSDVNIENDKTDYTLNEIPDYTPPITLKVTLDNTLEDGKSIYFTGTFEEAKDSSKTTWKTSVKGSPSSDRKTWSCKLTKSDSDVPFEWKAIKGDTVSEDTVVTGNINGNWQSDPNNKYEEVKDSSGTITSITGDSVNNPKWGGPCKHWWKQLEQNPFLKTSHFRKFQLSENGLSARGRVHNCQASFRIRLVIKCVCGVQGRV